MSEDNVWILGTYMTKFGRHTDKDLIDLASEAALAAMKAMTRPAGFSRERAIRPSPSPAGVDMLRFNRRRRCGGD